MSLAVLIVILHILNTLELALGGEGKALGAGIFEEGPSMEGDDVGLTVLLEKLVRLGSVWRKERESRAWGGGDTLTAFLDNVL